MGVGSGTLQGIESLDLTLSEIERKLSIIENAHVKIGSDSGENVIFTLYKYENLVFTISLFTLTQMFGGSPILQDNKIGSSCLKDVQFF